MSRHLKKILFIFPIFLFGMILFSSINIGAAEKATAVYDAEVVEGYYFQTSSRITITTKRKFAMEMFVKYRVITPEQEDGRRLATDWIKYEHAHNDLTNLEFEVDFKKLYDEQEGQILVNKYVHAYSEILESKAKGAYHIQIQFYEGACTMFFGCPEFLGTHKPKHDITISVVRSNAAPQIEYRFNTAGKLLAKTETDGIIKEAKIFYTNELLTSNNEATFMQKYNETSDKRDITTIMRASMKGEEEIPLLDGAAERYDYAYILVLDGNEGANSIDMVNLKTRQVEGGGNTGGGKDTERKPTDRYGETIIIALSIVLVVTASLIVAQKISDRKKIY